MAETSHTFKIKAALDTTDVKAQLKDLASTSVGSGADA